MILVVCLALGLTLRYSAGSPIRYLGQVRLRGEAGLIALLCLQAVIPLVKTTSGLAEVAYWVWLGTFPVLIGVALHNRTAPGMVVVALGLLLNLLVMVANGGMPVMSTSASAAGMQGGLTIAAGDFVHVLGTAATRLPWLADAIPLAGPKWFRFVPSPGDLLLYAGVVAFVAGAHPPVQGGRPRLK